MRVHLINKLHEWKRTGTVYPEFISLNLLNITTWVAIIAIICSAGWSMVCAERNLRKRCPPSESAEVPG